MRNFPAASLATQGAEQSGKRHGRRSRGRRGALVATGVQDGGGHRFVEGDVVDGGLRLVALHERHDQLLEVAEGSCRIQKK